MRSSPEAARRADQIGVRPPRTESVLKTAVATEDVGIKTLLKLRTQTEQLQRIDNHVVETDGILNATSRTIQSMKSIPERLFSWLTSSKQKSEIQLRREAEAKSGETTPSSPVTHIDSQRLRASRNNIASQRSLEGNQTDALDALSATVRNLHGIAKDMNSELTAQSKILGGLDHDINSLDSRIRTQSRAIRNLT